MVERCHIFEEDHHGCWVSVSRWLDIGRAGGSNALSWALYGWVGG